MCLVASFSWKHAWVTSCRVPKDIGCSKHIFTLYYQKRILIVLQSSNWLLSNKQHANILNKKLGIIAKAYQPKGNHPKINEKMKKGMFQECKHLISEKEKRKNIDCSIQNHQLKEFARELLKGKAISSNPFKFNLKCDFFI